MSIEKMNFKRWVHKVLPAVYDESLSYYELLCKITAKLNEVIDQGNSTSEGLKELKDYVDNYFEDLDVQEEINNKLDDMAESGQLTDIIAQYLQLAGILAYNTVSDLKSAENLVNGSFVKTYGYNNAGDNGGAFYKVRNVTNEDVIDEATIIALHDVNLVAVLMIDDNSINPEQFGCVGDGSADDTTNFTKAFNYAITNSYDFNAEKTYKITNALTVSGNYHNIYMNSIVFNGSTNFLNIKGSYNNIKINKVEGNGITSQGAIVLQSEYNTILNAHNKIEFDFIDGFNKGIYLDGETAGSYGIQYNEIKGGIIDKNTTYGIYLGIETSENARWINQNYFDKIRTNCIYDIYMVNNVDRNSMNSNIFNEIGVEPDPDVDCLYGIYNKNTQNNKFINCRASEINTNETLINEINTGLNYYEFTQLVPINKLNMVSGVLQSSLGSTDNQMLLSAKGAEFFADGSYLLLDNEWKKTGRIYNAYNANLDLTANDRKDVAYDMVYRFGADANNDYIFKLNSANVNRTIVKVCVTNLPGTFTITVKDKDDNILVSPGLIDSPGVWTIEKESSNVWYAYK